MIPVMVKLSGIPGNQKVNTITRAQRESLCSLLKAFPFTVIAAGSWDEAVVTAGGVSVKEIDPKTMASKLIPGLYFAGEIMDVDAYTGGFNLQIAWSTGYCAGQAASEGERSMTHFNIAIDGPSGAGKSTIARALAQQLQSIYIDTGAMYRAIGLYAAERGLEITDKAGVIALLPEIQLELRFEEGAQHILINGRDVSGHIRTESASMWASAVSAIPEVRTFLLEFQRSFAKSNNVLMDGRDIGTVVLPDAELKIFLTASAEARAMRRYLEQKAKGEDVTFEQVLEAMRQRDLQDSTRAAAPLKAAHDAIIVDTTEMDLEQSIVFIRNIVREKLCV